MKRRHFFLFCLVWYMAFVQPSMAVQRTMSWDPTTTYTDNTAIESTNLPVTYDAWFIDNTTGTRYTLVTGTTSTSVIFQDTGLVKGRVYLFQGKAYVKDGTGSADSLPYSWSRPYQIPADPKNTKITP